MSNDIADDNIVEMICARGQELERRIEDRRERDKQRKREARKAQTDEQRQREAARKREFRKRQTSEQRERDQERKRKKSQSKLRPFMGIDGEGGGTDFEGRQNYLFIAAGNSKESHICHRDGEHLLTRTCLEFILSLPREPILVGFYFVGL